MVLFTSLTVFISDGLYLEFRMDIKDTCRNFIRTLPSLTYSSVDPEDVDTSQEDHAYDECRYVLMAGPIASSVSPRPKAKPYSPLDEGEQGRYEWLRL